MLLIPTGAQLPSEGFSACCDQSLLVSGVWLGRQTVPTASENGRRRHLCSSGSQYYVLLGADHAGEE